MKLTKLLLMLAVLLPKTVLALSSDQTELLMESSGLDAMIEQLPQQMILGARGAYSTRGSQNESGEDFEVMSGAMLRAMDRLDLRSAMVEELAGNVSETDASVLLEFFQSELGAQIIQAEIDAGTPEAAADMQRRAQALLLSEERVELAQRMDRVVGATEIGMEVQESVMLAVVKGVANLKGQDPDDTQRVLDSIKEELEASFIARRGIISQTMVLTYVYTYKKLPIHDVKSYVDFLEQPESQKFYDIVIKTLVTGMELWAINFASEMFEATNANQPPV